MAVARSADTGTTTTAPGWRTTTRRARSPSGASIVSSSIDRNPAFATSVELVTRNPLTAHHGSRDVGDRPLGEGEPWRAALGPEPARLDERREQRMGAVGPALELRMGLGRD